jgi:hypothetical protein
MVGRRVQRADATTAKLAAAGAPAFDWPVAAHTGGAGAVPGPGDVVRGIAFNQALGNPYLVVPGLAEKYRDSAAAWQETAGLFNRLAEQAAPQLPGSLIAAGHTYRIPPAVSSYARVSRRRIDGRPLLTPDTHTRVQ